MPTLRHRVTADHSDGSNTAMGVLEVLLAAIWLASGKRTNYPNPSVGPERSRSIDRSTGMMHQVRSPGARVSPCSTSPTLSGWFFSPVFEASADRQEKRFQPPERCNETVEQRIVALQTSSSKLLLELAHPGLHLGLVAVLGFEGCGIGAVVVGDQHPVSGGSRRSRSPSARRC